MSIKTLAWAYVVGGLTFPLLIITAILSVAWYSLPSAKDARATGGKNEELEDTIANTQSAAQEDTPTPDTAASGSFAVLREYNFPAAIQALNARNATTSASSSAAGATDGSTDTGSSSSESVYQSMYRSVFDRNKNANAANSVLANDNDGDGIRARAKRRAVGASLFYIVLRHGHLMLYDSAAQMEVRHVISLAHHVIALSEGPGGHDEEAPLKEADLFIKRTAIVLTPTTLPAGREQQQSVAMSQPRPFYLFSSSCSEKEDFYHALLTTRNPPPIARSIGAEDIIKLQSTLHATAMTAETRAFNAMVGRVFLAIYRTPFIENLVRNKIEKKIARVQKPAFIASLDVKSIDLGNSAPVISNPRLRDINISGDTTIALDIRYNGGVKVVISALAKLDLGPRFKTRTVDLMLATSLRRLQGHMSFRIKAPPSNRIWFCFDTIPDMDIKVEPIVSQRQITYTFILRAIEERIRAVVGETLVKPNWDDVPFFDTADQAVRGGIWCDEGTVSNDADENGLDQADAMQAAKRLGAKHEKTKSMPSLVSAAAETESAAASSGAEYATGSRMTPATTLEDLANIRKRQSTASLPSQDPTGRTSAENGDKTPALPPKSLRSPSFTSPSVSTPSVALDGANVAPVRSDDASLQPKRWRPRASLANQTRKEAVDAIREMHERVRGTEPVTAEGQPADRKNSDAEEANSDGTGTPSRASSITSSAPRSLQEQHRTDSEMPSIGSVGSSASTKSPQQRKNILAATAAATNAARNWSWNAIANRTGKGRGEGLGRQPNSFANDEAANSAQGPGALQKPIGRGQPLPPPGTPLPGPQKTLWQAAANGLGGVGKGMASVRRKPVLPPRRANTQHATPSVGPDRRSSQTSLSAASDRPSSQSSAREDRAQKDTEDDHERNRDEAERSGDDEFGPWRENSGNVSDAAVKPSELDELAETLEEEGEDASIVALPAERGLHSESASTLADEENHDDQAEGKPDKPNKIPPPLPARRRPQAERQKSAENISRDNAQLAPEGKAGGSGVAGMTDTTADHNGPVDELAGLSGQSNVDILRGLMPEEEQMGDKHMSAEPRKGTQSSEANVSHEKANEEKSIEDQEHSRDGTGEKQDYDAETAEEKANALLATELHGGEASSSSNHARDL
ncbi:hypothetical protein EJ03DRAFT_331871 [Teratosphaeria nubilosa]|uniref:SMP-LTD domain-containing protein n=1 Tax=Teratosphaeria nubilosa TaxID=161662 RepID=A0A6G1KUS2_9PEZI|nr:hypothetical protein EJ03DRAFT_331871 [Teratosphaeria nubilosa]